MRNYLNPYMASMLSEMPAQGLAHIGDAVFELMARTYLFTEGVWSADKLHDRTVALVSAKAQAKAVQIILSILNEEETETFKRGRNIHSRPAPKSSKCTEYHYATGVETLFGHLYLSGEIERVNELFEMMVQSETINED